MRLSLKREGPVLNTGGISRWELLQQRAGIGSLRRLDRDTPRPNRLEDMLTSELMALRLLGLDREAEGFRS